MNLNELRQRRATLITEARAVNERTGSDGALSAEDQAHYDRLMTEARNLKASIERAEVLEAEERELAASTGTTAARREQPGAGENRGDQPEQVEVRFERRTGRESTRSVTIARNPEAQRAFARYLRGGLAALGDVERRALQADVDASGGFLRPYQEFVAKLIQAVDDQVYIRQRATVMTVGSADSIGMPQLTADPDDADWTSELATGSEDSSMAIGKREMRPNPLAKRLKVSNKLLRQTGLPGAIDVETLVRQRLGYKFAVPQEKGFLTGNGVGRPLGVFVASDDGIPTSRDASTGNTATEIQTDGLQEALWLLKPQYRRNAEWMFHRDGLKQIAKLKDGEGQYVWRPGLVAGAPDQLLNRPYMESEFAPNTFTTGQYVGLLGDWSFYWIVDSLMLQIKRLDELYAETNQVGFIGRLECDGAPVLGEAFARVKLG